MPVAWAEAAARLFEPPAAVTRWPTPGHLARDIDPRIIQTPALDLLDAALVDAADGVEPRLLFSMPPQEGKSQRVSRAFPFWLLLRNPDTRIGIVSYSDALARRWGRTVRNDIVSHPEFGLALARDSKAANEWQIDGRDGGVITVGIRGSLTGRPLDCLIIDDPLKGRKEANSQVERDTVKDFWTGTGSTRLSEGAIVVDIQTRWHEDDFMGWQLAGNPGDWRHINIPALADHNPGAGETDPLGREPGAWMLSARGRTVRGWEKRRKDAGSREFAALFQGRPSPAEGDVFKRGWFQIYDTPRAVQHIDGTWQALGVDQIIASWDMAFKDTRDSDYVVGQVWGRRGADAFLLDQVRARLDFTASCHALEAQRAKWPQITAVLVEDKANGPAVIAQLRHRVPGLIPVEPRDSKYARASAVAPFCEAGNIHIPDPSLAAWIGDWIEEIASFPQASHDDQVDAMTQALHRLYIEGATDSGAYMSELLAARG